MGLNYNSGDKVVALEQVKNNIGEVYQAGTEFIVCRVDHDSGDMAMRPVDVYEEGDSGIWYWPVDCVTKFKLVSDKVSGETSGPTPRVTYLYVVEDDDGAYIKTFDRAYAREIKAELGGKKAGVIITAYAAVKEIR